VFSYWFEPVDGDADGSLWLLAFYERVRFVTMTTPRDLLPPGSVA
jgi:hypothetical protein